MKLFQKMSNNQARCLLCPRYCELGDGEVGACHARANYDGEICPKDYGAISALAISALAVEPIEKKPLTHFLPGTKTLSLGGWGCNLRCVGCENHKISQHSISKSESKLDAKQMSPKNIIEIAKEKDCPSICMTYNEPTIAIEYLLELGKKCHENDLKFIIKTNAYINDEPWEEVCEVVDAMNIDYKGSFESFEDVTQCRYKDYGKKILIAYYNDVHIELSIPILPGYSNDDGCYFWPLISLMDGADADDFKKIPCHLLKINPAHLMINERTTSDREIAKAKEDLSYIFSEEYIHTSEY